ncbi:MAG: 2-hydroxyglutaryl-CoA dehydratase, partial [Bacillota bacterium]
MNCCYLGIDIGSVSSNFVAVDQNLQVIKKLYLRTQGQPINVIKKGLSMIKESLQEYKVQG